MRKALAAAGVLLVVVVASAATLGSTASGSRNASTINIAVFLASSANTYWEAELEGAQKVRRQVPEREADRLRREFTTKRPGEPAAERALSNKYQAWFIGPNDGGPLTPTIKQAIAKGVKVAARSCRAARTSVTSTSRSRAR